MVQLHLKYLHQIDNFFCHVLMYPAHKDRIREPFFQSILGPAKMVAFASIPEAVEILRELQPAILHFTSGGIPEFPMIAGIRNILPKTKLVQTTVFGHQNSQVKLDAVVYVAKHVQHLVGKFGPEHHVVRNPIEGPCTNKTLRSELKLGQFDNDFVFGRIGRDSDEIYDPINLEAYAQIQNNRTWFLAVSPSSRCIADAHRLRLERFIALEKTVDDDWLSRFYNTIDVLAHSRRDGECCPANIFEAMAHGVPIISHYANPFNGQVDAIGNAGFVVAPGDVKEYARIMGKFVDGTIDRKRLSQNARNRALEETNVVSQAGKLLDIYKTILSK